MAQIMPNSPLYNTTGSPAEIKVFDILKTKLPDDWVVIHSFRWVKSKPAIRGKAQGEGDFILFNPDKGILVIEVKGGDISYHNRMWSTTDGQGQEHIIQDPEKQASDTKFEIINRLKAKYLDKCLVCHAVWFPDCDVSLNHFPANLDMSIVFDMYSLDSPLSLIEEAFNYWYQRSGFVRKPLSTGDSEKILSLLNPEFRLVKTMRSRCDDLNVLYVRLNTEQARLLEMLDECHEIHVVGRAGTGKTLLALEKGRRDATKGRRTIMLCYNNELAQRLKDSNHSSLHISSVHSYALAYMKKHHPNRVIGFLDNPNFDYLMNEFIEVASVAKDKFDTILIDEGQDFKDSWIRSIHNLMAEDGNFFVFYDPYQYLYAPLTELDDAYLKIGAPVVLKRNMRNTDQISRACLHIINQSSDKESLSGVCGLEPELICYELEDLDTLLEKALHKLKHLDGIDNERISVITLDTENGSFVSENLQRRIYEFKTVRKFKGLENDIVIIVDANLAHIIDPVRQRLLYVALSRARVHSIILMQIDSVYKNYLMKEWSCSEVELLNRVNIHIREGS